MPSVSRGKATCHIALPAMTDGGPPAEAAPLRPPPATGDRRSRRAPPVGPGYLLCLVRWKRNDVFYATRLLFDPGSETAGCAHPRRSPSYVEEPWSPNLASCS
jgi:hypothetical protein